MLKNDNQADVIFAMSSETIGRQDPGTRIHIIDTDEDFLVAEDGVTQYPISVGGGGGGSSADGKFVGNVKEGGAFPTERKPGEALHNDDYVRPIAPFPFTIDGITFNSTRDKAYYQNGIWQLDAGVIQDTSETPVKSKTAESLSGNSNYQSAINAENKTAIEDIESDVDGKVDKSTIDNKQLLYARENGTEKTVIYGAGADLGSGTVPTRVTGGNLQVGTPTADNHAVPKSYVDNQHYVHEQTSASSTWEIEHNMGYYPNVTVIDSAGSICQGDIEYLSENKVKLTFSGAMSGKAYLS